MTIPDLSRSEIEFLIQEWIIGNKAERNRKIISRRLFDGRTYEELAEEFDLSVQCVKQIVYKEQNRIFRHAPGR